MKYLALTFMLAATGCAQTQPTSEVRSPYERYLPQAPPAETNRIEFAEGYSIVSPIGWTSQTVPIQAFLKDYVADQIEITGHEADDCPPRITIQHLGPSEYASFHAWLQSTQSLSDGWMHTNFQAQPALSKFRPGFGSRLAVGPWFDRGYEPYLTQELFFERDGSGFMLMFEMRNADKDKPYYTRPVPIIEQYFETFQFRRPSK